MLPGSGKGKMLEELGKTELPSGSSHPAPGQALVPLLTPAQVSALARGGGWEGAHGGPQSQAEAQWGGRRWEGGRESQS